MVFITKSSGKVGVCNKKAYGWESQTPSDIWGGYCNSPLKGFDNYNVAESITLEKVI
jgi:hypothetical protein